MTSLQAVRKVAVVPKATLTRRGPVALVKSGATRLWELCQIEERRLLPLSKPSEHFHAAIDRHWLFNLNLNATLGGVLFTALGDLIVSGVTLGVVGAVDPSGFGIAVPLLAIGQLAWVPSGVALRKVHVAKKRNFNAFLLWMQGRYGVTLNRKQGLSSHLAAPNSHGTRDFRDDSGRWLQLANDGYSGYIVRPRGEGGELPSVAAALEPVKTKANRKALSAPAVQLPHELKALFYQIEEHLQVLSGRALSPESDHVVARAARDRDAVMALVADLIRLKVSSFDEAQDAAIKRTFTTLLAELQEVLRKETTFALEALNIENTYVALREAKPGIRLQKELGR